MEPGPEQPEEGMAPGELPVPPFNTNGGRRHHADGTPEGDPAAGEDPWSPRPGFVADRGEALGGGRGLAPVGVARPPGPGGGFDDDFDDEPTGRRRRPRWVRVVGLVVALALVLASVSTWVGILLGSGGGPAVQSAVGSVGPVPGRPAAADLEQVTFTLANTGSNPVTASCTVLVVRDGQTLGLVRARAAQPLPAGEEVRAQVSVPLDRPAFAGTADDARVSCTT
ncbi:MAG: hypothetical protein ACLP9C_13975 [Acidimicrobiales bacterium]